MTSYASDQASEAQAGKGSSLPKEADDASALALNVALAPGIQRLQVHWARLRYSEIGQLTEIAQCGRAHGRE